jgi:hypothetical protein
MYNKKTIIVSLLVSASLLGTYGMKLNVANRVEE